MKIYEAVAHALQEEGVETVFGLMGDGNLRLLNYWTNELGKGYYGSRHESAAVGMADGYARVSGEVGVCTVTQGPGVTNSLTALVTARKAHTPLVLMVGDVASFQSGWPQDIDHQAVFDAAGVPLVSLADPGTAFSDVVKALRLARDTRGPVGINMPTDTQEREWNAWNDETDVVTDRRPMAAASSGETKMMADLLASAETPAILAGRGAVESGCTDLLVSIGDRIGAVFATSLRGKGAFGEHEFSVGVAGGLGSNVSAQVLGEADVVLVVGASMNDFTMMRGNLLSPSARVIRCDDDPRAKDHGGAERLTVVADAALAMEALDSELARREVAGEGFRPRAAKWLADYRPEDEFAAVVEADAVDPRSLVIALDRMLPADKTVVTDAGHFFGYPVAYVGIPDGRSFVCGIDFGSIGLGLGHAMGAAVARPDRPTILFIGDGGLLMSLGDLETAVRYRLPLTVFVLNDAAYGSELQILRMWELSEELSVFPPTDFSGVAASLGARVLSVRTLADLEALPEKLGDLTRASGVTVVDCAISQAVRAAWLEEAFRH